MIELLIVTGIAGLLLTISFPTFSRFKDVICLQALAHSTAMDLRKAQALAMCRNESQSCSGFTFSRTGAVQPGGSGTLVLNSRLGSVKKLIVSPIGRVRVE